MPELSKPCHDILSVSGYFRRLNADTRRTLCLSLRQELQPLVATQNALFFLVLRLNDNFLPISEALGKPSEGKESDSALPPEPRFAGSPPTPAFPAWASCNS